MQYVVILVLIGGALLLISCSSKNKPKDEVLPGVPSVMQYDDYYSCSNAKEVLSADEKIIEVASDKTLHVVGTGSTVVTIDGIEYNVTTQKAKLAVILCIGQSNMTVISTGNEKLAVKPPLGTAYWNTMEDRASLSSIGVKGLFGAFSDTFYKTSGEKCLMIQAAMGGTSIGQWQTNSDYLGQAINAYNNSVSQLKNYTDYYEITRTGYIWLQGETDCKNGMSATQYFKSFFKMHEKLNNDCTKVITNSEKAFSFAGILSVRSWSGRNKYERPLNIVFTGPRSAQYAIGNSDSIKVDNKDYDTSDIYLITNITENWYSDESVASWFASDKLYYKQDAGVVKMVANLETDLDALMPPDISSASNTTYPDQHYLQKGYNEMGADAGKNLANILKSKQGTQTESIEYSVVLRDFNGIVSYKNGDEAVITRTTATLVPCVTNLSATNYSLTYEFTSEACPNAYVDEFGQIIGLLNDTSGDYKVFLNNGEEPVLTVKVIMSDPNIITPVFSWVEGSNVYLSDLIGSKECLSWKVNMADSSMANPPRRPGKNKNYNASKLSVADIVYEKGIGLHPQATADSEIEFDISKYGCDKFYAIVGSPGLTDFGNGVICSVYVDYGEGKYILLEKSGVLAGEIVHVFDLNIDGAEKIKLIVNSNGNMNSDSTTWAYSVIYKEKNNKGEQK